MRNLRWYAIVTILIGLVCLMVAYFWSVPSYGHFHPMASFLLTNIGGLLIFVAGYTLISEFYLKQQFLKDLLSALDSKLKAIKLDQSIVKSGLSEIEDRFSDERLLRRMRGASRVKMLVMRNDNFFRANHPEMLRRIAENHLYLEVILPNPSNAPLMALLSMKYSDLPTGQQLADSVANSVNTWLRNEIWAKLADSQKRNLKVSLSNRYPLYSAYVFDDKELWYIPYHQRRNWQPIPTFVFRDRIEHLELYKDIEDTIDVETHDLNRPLDDQR